MDLLYRKTPEGICLERCYTLDDAPVLPEFMDEMPVTELDRYLFSQTVRGRSLPPAESAGQPELCGEGLRELTLPRYLKKVGPYAFYNCFRLETLSFWSTVDDWGAGVFTGCTGIKELKIRILPRQKSCFKEILSELRQELTVDYLDPEGRLLARLIFPEFFEESVENTPARIIMREMHGCGHMYRYCFSDTQFQFREYDRLFPNTVILEKTELAVRMAAYRLYWPWELAEEFKSQYWSYLKQYPQTLAEGLLKRQELELLKWISRQEEADGDFLNEMLAAAGKKGDPQASAVLLDAVHSRFGGSSGKKKTARTFEL